MGFKFLKKIFGSLCHILLMVSHCQPSLAREATPPIRTQIALQLSPFFSFLEPSTIHNYCIYRDPGDEISAENLNGLVKNIMPRIQPKIYYSINQISNECQFMLIDSVEPSNVLAISKNIKEKSLLIGLGANAIQYGYDIGLVKNGNHYEIHLNLKSMRLKKITPNPQIIKLSKVVIQ